MSKPNSRRCAIALAAALALPVAAAAAAPSYAEVVAMDGASGSHPVAPLTRGPDGLLYGVASEGGAFGRGSVFRVEADGRTTLLHSFADDGSEGVYPSAGLLLASDGWLYGGTADGFPDHGSIFRISTAGEFALVHVFTAADHGAHGPAWALVQDEGGSFYGVSLGIGWGEVFRMAPDGTLALLHVFEDKADGAWPSGPLLRGRDGTLYGTTSHAHGAQGGTVFAIGREGRLQTLHTFASATDGCSPQGSLAEGRDHRIWGMAYFCGPQGAGGETDDGLGTIFSVGPHGDFAVAHVFHYDDPLGWEPQGGLVADAQGTLHGTASGGGANLGGTVFSFSPAGKGRVLHAFAWGSATDGMAPAAAPTLLPDGSLYGTTWIGGATLDGTVYKVSPAR